MFVLILWSNRNDENQVFSDIGKIRLSCASGRKPRNWPFASVTKGTGAPDKRNLCPITPGRMGEIAGQPLPSFGLINGFVAFKAVLVPLDAKKA